MREGIRIKDLRMATIPDPRRPHYRPTERLAILELRAARGWSLEQTARVFQVAHQLDHAPIQGGLRQPVAAGITGNHFCDAVTARGICGGANLLSLP